MRRNDKPIWKKTKKKLGGKKKKLKGHVKTKGLPTSDNEKKKVRSGGGNLYSSM